MIKVRHPLRRLVIFLDEQLDKFPRLWMILALAVIFFVGRWPDEVDEIFTTDGSTDHWVAESLEALVWTILLILTLTILFRLRHRLLRIDCEEDVASPDRARRVLIMTLSPLKPQKMGPADAASEPVPPSEYLKLFENREDAFRLISLKKTDAEKLVGEEKKFTHILGTFPWQQNIRAIKAQESKLERVVVLTSEESKKQFGEFKSFAEALWAKNHSRSIEIVQADATVDGMEFSGVVGALKKVIKQEMYPRAGSAPIKESDICIDVTSGRKPYSIGGAIVSLNSDVICSYTTDQEGEVRIIDAGVSLHDTVV